MSIQNVITNTSAIAGQWQHVVGVYDGSTYSVYIDGVLDSATPRTDSVTASEGPDTKIGAFDLGRYPYNGLVDEIQFFNRALSASEIQAIFAAGSANGGTGGNRDCNYAGGGSGGAIRLVSNTITGSGSTSVVGGLGSNSNPNNAGVAGRVRFEAFSIGCCSVGGNYSQSNPLPLFLPTTPPPSMLVTSINGTPVTENPFSGSRGPDPRLFKSERVHSGFTSS